MPATSWGCRIWITATIPLPPIGSRNARLDASPDGPWTNGARYNLARCYEQMGQLDKAQQLYLIDESPQRHGNLIRARRLEKKIRTRHSQRRRR